ncbi:phosphate starvation-inducible protein PhoH [Reichenbachiella sp. 5M10]|uniref:PhoH family protein n=1 Tax=Reichenbachiella sp. 5M10 TaxID=1889772 RepID=UPI000C15E8FC|nr:PhoH family protein [Reichenbachiella sp. 5M10]PIB34107.1 phosphate starvation-inducible protein PhoH [Reichenbachiella sp. 5M10]
MAKKVTKKKIFVLDTSVILFSHDSIMNFAEHDVGIPITVLEELDNFKKGNDTLNFEAREFARLLDNLAADHMLQDWIPLNGKGRGKLKVLMYSDTKTDVDAEVIFGDRKNDHKIINAALKLQKEEPGKKVILVSKDINLRLKAKSLDLSAEDYETGKIKNVDSMGTLGKSEINRVAATTIDELYKKGAVDAKKALGKVEPINNCYYILKSSKNSALSFYNPVTAQVSHVEKRSVYGIKPKNAEQAFAIHAMMNPEVKLVAITGVAGTGKTLMALASALQQRREFKQIYIARPIVPLSNKDIGYLPGDIKSKLNPYMEPLWDNLKFIQNQWKETEKENKQLTEMVNQEKVLITPLAYIRGRSLSNIYFIVDEAQNLTPHEVKTIITRAGENCKIVFTGDVHQIDTPYLDSQSNGLSYLVDRLQGQSLFAHVTLEKGERSELANIANELL